MFLLNLCPFRVRNSEQSHAWIALPALARIPAGQLGLLGACHQVEAPEAVQHGPWVHETFGTAAPGASAGVRRFTVPGALLTRINDSFDTAPDLERAMAEEGFQEYREWLFRTLAPIAHEITAIITPALCRSLQDVARYLNLRVIRLDGSPIRRPLYRFDCHALDFSNDGGVGEAERRYHRWRAACLPRLAGSFAELRTLLLAGPPPAHDEGQEPFEVGLALQDDMGMAPMDRAWTLGRLLSKARQVFPPDRILIREHPNAVLRLAKPDDFGVLDGSATSAAFVKRCKRLLTISSSVAFDAVLMGVPAYVLGGSCLGLIAHPVFDRHVWGELHDIPDLLGRMEFLATGFYVPSALFLDPAYLRFRLADPDEGAIRAAHLQTWEKKRSRACGDPPPL